MAPPLAELTAHAQSLTSSGDLAAARAVLADALAPVDADPQHASPDLAAAAAMLASILVTLGDPLAARDWASFAHAAQRRLHGPHDQRTVAATATHAAVLHRIGKHDLAAQLYRHVVGQLIEADGPDSLRVLAAQADLAIAEHAAGECVEALARMADAWHRHRRLYGDAAPAGIKMLARLGGMERDCGRVTESREHLALADELCARYLPGDHVLVRQVAALARAQRSDEHSCATTQALSADQTPSADQAPSAGQGFVADQGFMPERDVPAERDHPAEQGSDASATRRPLTVAAVVAVGLLVAVAAVRLTLPADDPGSATALPPAVLQPSNPATAGPTAEATSGAPASGAPASGAPASGAPGEGPTGQGPAGQGPTGSGPAGTGAPTAVELRDGGDSVTLRWIYPTGAEGPVLISGGRTGQERRAFQQVPAGSDSYVVYGLNDRSDYCFTVAVVYSADDVAEAAPVCTVRS